MKALLMIALGFGVSAQAADPVLLKTAREIYASYVNITGIDEHDSDLRELYKQDFDRLPKRGTTDELNNSVVLAMTELGGAFCRKAVLREKDIAHGQRFLFSEIDFKRGPSQFNDFKRSAIISGLAQSFWEREATDAEKPALLAAINSAGDDTPERTVRVAQILCTTFATSLAFLTK